MPEQSPRCRIKNDEFCITNDEFCIKNDGFCIKNDEFSEVSFMHEADKVLESLELSIENAEIMENFS